MISNESSFIDRNGQVRILSDTNNSLTISTNRLSSDENVLRLASKLIFYQTNKNKAEKFNSIFLPYLKTWCKSSNL
jgi:hypothetical protein